MIFWLLFGFALLQPFVFGDFLTWIVTILVTVVLSVLQELGQEYNWGWVTFFQDQRILSILLAVVVGGGIAALFEFVLGVDLFSDIATWADVGRAILAVLAGTQSVFGLFLHPRAKARAANK